MLILFFSIIFIMIILNLIFILLNLIINKNMNMNFLNTIECGFNNLNNKHMPMYMNFFYILMIFLIFDLEFFIIVPFIFMLKNSNWMKLLMLMIFTFMFIYFSLMYEIKFNSIKWIK